jgi:sialate O-acetylesterase
MAVGAVVVSSKDAKMPPEETKKLAAASLEEGVPTHQLRAGKGEADLLLLIPEARQYTLVFDLDLAKLKKPVAYDVDRRADVTKPFDRIAYLIELQKGGAPGQFVFVSMDAFTADAAKIGIPDVGTKFQMKVAAMNVHSNVEGFVTGMNLDGGNIEFWSNNYGPGNSAGIPGADHGVFDFGDGAGDPVDGYGSMQVHNYKAGLTLFAINHWRNGGGSDIGIGNSGGNTKDWTFTSNAGSYSYKRLRILVRQKA